jgi:hypothetical protein
MIHRLKKLQQRRNAIDKVLEEEDKKHVSAKKK